MKELFDKILSRPVATGILISATAAGIVTVIKAINKTK